VRCSDSDPRLIAAIITQNIIHTGNWKFEWCLAIQCLLWPSLWEALKTYGHRISSEPFANVFMTKAPSGGTPTLNPTPTRTPAGRKMMFPKISRPSRQG
jgi:hypothetical protein